MVQRELGQLRLHPGSVQLLEGARLRLELELGHPLVELVVFRAIGELLGMRCRALRRREDLREGAYRLVHDGGDAVCKGDDIALYGLVAAALLL